MTSKLNALRAANPKKRGFPEKSSKSKRSESLPQVSWRRVFEHTGRLRGFLIRIFLSATGLLFTSLYLKQCAVHLQQYYAGSPVIVGKSAVNGIFKHMGLLNPLPGRLACTLSGAGKRRLFAIGNYVRQRLLHPVHDWAMRVLSRIPTDVTFNQERPIHRLSRFKPSDVLSLSFSSATDRWPVVVLTAILTRLFGRATALCVVNGSFWCNVFRIHRPLVKKARYVHFATGQPLGYYGSWALFSLSHHYMVWLAAWFLYPRRKAPFRKYALLGDDIVIADRAVAEKYQALLDILDVSISESKSIDSKTGALEFAKQFWIEKVSINLTPVSAKAILASGSLIGLCQLAEKYNLSRSCLSRLAGAGYRVRGRILSSRLSRRWKRLRVVSDRSLSDYRLPLDLWLGRGNPLNPYLKGIMIDRVGSLGAGAEPPYGQAENFLSPVTDCG
ncbi:hypothetical protein ZIOFF_074518 (mitochondrion) [Zingiber officinale]|uniref:RNA-dependent RNA polymerase n=1 Tax=Zingiber officinale TaxID=94328 RepID=A0A8J5C5L5_ZINOF|nr:hypothetical protein ZIOFF_074518 [Zingiber officinale]